MHNQCIALVIHLSQNRIDLSTYGLNGLEKEMSTVHEPGAHAFLLMLMHQKRHCIPYRVNLYTPSPEKCIRFTRVCGGDIKLFGYSWRFTRCDE